MKRYTRADVFTGFRLHMALKTHDLDAIFPVRPFSTKLWVWCPRTDLEASQPPADDLEYYAAG
jgi:hypothetical protein